MTHEERVMEQRGRAIFGGCCDHFANKTGCDCVEQARARDRRENPDAALTLIGKAEDRIAVLERTIKEVQEQNAALAAMVQRMRLEMRGVRE